MSRQIVEIVRRWYEEWNTGEDIRAVVERRFTPDAEWETPPDLPDSEVCRGREAIVEMLEALTSDIGRFRTDIRAISEVGGTVLVEFTIHGAGARGGVPVQVDAVHLHELRDDRFTRVRAFLDRDQAMAAVEGG